MRLTHPLWTRHEYRDWLADTLSHALLEWLRRTAPTAPQRDEQGRFTSGVTMLTARICPPPGPAESPD